MTDGTGAGTHLVRDVRPGPGPSRPDGLAVMGGSVWFAAYDDSGGRELWRSDGTASGTVRVADLAPGAAGSRPREVTVAGGKVFFTADVGKGREIWVSEAGTAAPHVVVDWTLYPERPGPWDSSESRWLAAAGDRVVFLTRDARDPEDFPDVALVGTDGTEAGTERLTPSWNLDPSSWMHVVGGAQSAGGQVWVRANHRIYRTDGTLAGTTFEPWYEYDPQLFSELAPAGNRALFAAQEGAVGLELYLSEPGGVGHRLVADLAPGLDGSEVRHGAPADFLRVGGRWAFSAHEPTTGRELWVSDGTGAGTRRVTDKASGAADFDPEPMLAHDGMLLLRGGRTADGDELWISDGTATGTLRLADLAPGPRGSHASSAHVLGDRVILVADDGHTGSELWSMPLSVLDGPPDTRVTSAPRSPTNQTSATVSFDSPVTTATFACRLDAGSWSPCTSPWTGAVGAGRHALAVRASSDGLADPTPATASWTVDLTAPNTRFTATPRSPTTSRRAVFRFVSNDAGATFQCRRDSRAWAKCSSPRTYRRLSLGRHVMRVRAVDRAGNRDGTPAVYRWRVVR